MLLRPGGVSCCSTPNLYRMRNLVYLLRGRSLFGHFDVPEARSYRSVIEYTAEHLARSSSGPASLTAMSTLSTESADPRRIGMLSGLGAPLRRIPRYRDNLFAVAIAP